MNAIYFLRKSNLNINAGTTCPEWLLYTFRGVSRSFWVDKEQHQQEKRAILNEALAHISDGRVSPIASTLNSNWESISSIKKGLLEGTLKNLKEI